MARRRRGSEKSTKPSRAERSVAVVSDRAGILYAETFLPIVNYIGSVAARHLGPTAVKILTDVYNDDLHSLTGGYAISPDAFKNEHTVVDMVPNSVSDRLTFGMHLHFSVPLPSRFVMNLEGLSVNGRPIRTGYGPLLAELRAELACLRPLALQLSTERNLGEVAGVVYYSSGVGTAEPITLGLGPKELHTLYAPPALALALLETLDPSGTWLGGIPSRHLSTVPLRSISLAGEKLGVLAALGRAFAPSSGDADTVSSAFTAPVPLDETIPLLRNCGEVISPVGFQVGSFEDISSLRYAGTHNKLCAAAGFWNFVARITDPV